MTNKYAKLVFAFAIVAALVTVPISTSNYAYADDDNKSTGFNALKKSAECIAETAGSANPWHLPSGWNQKIITSEDISQAVFENLPDMNQQNPVKIDMPAPLVTLGAPAGQVQVGQLVYATHEVGSGGSVSVQDLKTGIVGKLAERTDWNRLDGLRWTPWGTLLPAEEASNTAGPDKDPDVPTAVHGLFYEIDPETGSGIDNGLAGQNNGARPQLGSMPHEGIAIDKWNNIYVIDEFNGGAIYRFVPNADPSIAGYIGTGTLYALRVDSGNADTLTGNTAEWIALGAGTDPEIDARTAANEVGATNYNRPEDAEIIGNILYVATTGDRTVLAIQLKEMVSDSFKVTKYIKGGEGAANDKPGKTFESPDNLAVNGKELWIVEDNGPSDIWRSKPDNSGMIAKQVDLFASNEDCNSEGTGILWGIGPLKGKLLVNHQHAGPFNEPLDDEIGPDHRHVIYKTDFKNGDD
ncbi:MAG TPA: alkaline phosphatase PhoX [Nitrosopumilaceae archaeon]|jgi:hypothetical protein